MVRFFAISRARLAMVWAGTPEIASAHAGDFATPSDLPST